MNEISALVGGKLTYKSQFLYFFYLKKGNETYDTRNL